MSEISAVPKNLRRVSEDFHGYPYWFVFLVICSALITVSLVALIAAGYTKLIVFLLLFLSLFFGVARSPATLIRTKQKLSYYCGVAAGDTVTSKFRDSEKIVSKIVPIEKVHDDGLIEFKNKTYGHMLLVSPPRISDDDLESFCHRVMSLIDSLHGDITLKTYAVSMPSNQKSAEKEIRKVINANVERTTEEKDHLYSLYKTESENENQVIEWRFFVFFGLGKYDNIEMATQASERKLPGFSRRLAKSDLIVRKVSTTDEVVNTFRSMFQLKEL